MSEGESRNQRPPRVQEEIIIPDFEDDEGDCGDDCPELRLGIPIPLTIDPDDDIPFRNKTSSRQAAKRSETVPRIFR